MLPVRHCSSLRRPVWHERSPLSMHLCTHAQHVIALHFGNVPLMHPELRIPPLQHATTARARLHARSGQQQAVRRQLGQPGVPRARARGLPRRRPLPHLAPRADYGVCRGWVGGWVVAGVGWGRLQRRVLHVLPTGCAWRRCLVVQPVQGEQASTESEWGPAAAWSGPLTSDHDWSLRNVQAAACLPACCSTDSAARPRRRAAGVKVTDRAGLAALGAAPADVAALISEAFNEMIFAFGDVHCVSGGAACHAAGGLALAREVHSAVCAWELRALQQPAAARRRTGAGGAAPRHSGRDDAKPGHPCRTRTPPT